MPIVCHTKKYQSWFNSIIGNRDNLFLPLVLALVNLVTYHWRQLKYRIHFSFCMLITKVHAFQKETCIIFTHLWNHIQVTSRMLSVSKARRQLRQSTPGMWWWPASSARLWSLKVILVGKHRMSIMKMDKLIIAKVLPMRKKTVGCWILACTLVFYFNNEYALSNQK